MAAVLLACQMLEDEIQRAVQRTGAQMPIVWVDAGLHEYPDRLREELQRQIAYNRANGGVDGSIFYGYGALKNNTLGIQNSVAAAFQ